MRHRVAGTLVAMLLALPMAASANVDASIALTADGRLIGLPERYQPAALSIDFDAARVESMTLKIGKVEGHVPACAAAVVASRGLRDVSARASWHDDPAWGPPYLAVHFAAPPETARSDGDVTLGVTMLFDLDDAHLYEMTETRRRGNILLAFPVDVVARCGTDAAATFFRPLKPRPASGR